jgi:hypothetical protein
MDVTTFCEVKIIPDNRIIKAGIIILLCATPAIEEKKIKNLDLIGEGLSQGLSTSMRSSTLHSAVSLCQFNNFLISN